MAPTIAVSRMLERAGLKLQDFDFYEIHEAFAAQVLATLKAWEDPVYCKTHLGRDAPLGAIDRAKLNVKGSSLAFGHPFAATGARIVGNLAKLLVRARRARPDLGLHGRRHGRGGHHGEPQGRRDAAGGLSRGRPAPRRAAGLCRGHGHAIDQLSRRWANVFLADACPSSSSTELGWHARSGSQRLGLFDGNVTGPRRIAAAGDRRVHAAGISLADALASSAARSACP